MGWNHQLVFGDHWKYHQVSRFLWMMSKDSVGGKKRKTCQRWVTSADDSMLLFNVNYLCCSTSSTCFDFPQITTSDPEWLIAVRQRRTEESWKILKQKNRRNVSETPRNLNMNTMHWAEGILISTMLHYDSLTSFLTGFPRTSNFRRTEPQASSKERETSRVH